MAKKGFWERLGIAWASRSRATDVEMLIAAPEAQLGYNLGILLHDFFSNLPDDLKAEGLLQYPTSPEAQIGVTLGNGLANSISGTSVTRAGGGGGAGWITAPSGGTGGTGGGGSGSAGFVNGANTAGTNGTGSGGGGAAYSTTGGVPGAVGGTGVVIIRIPAANAPGALSVSPGTNSVATDSPTGDKICTFTVDGTLTLT